MDGNLFLVDATVKATILLLVAGLLARVCRRFSAAFRHQIWVMAVCGLIAIPAVSWIAPGWRLPMLGTISASREMHTPASESTPIAPQVAGPRVVETTAPPTVAEPVPVVSKAEFSAPKVVARPIVFAAKTPGIPRKSAPIATPWNWSRLLLAAWLAGVLVVALPIVLGVVLNEFRRRRLPLVTDDNWSALLEGTRRRFAIRRPIELRRSDDRPIPATWGVGRPVVILPEEAATWPETTRRVVLLHELAHVRRFDAGLQLMGRLACALYWFHPLAWYALHRLQFECEHACDDCVIQAGERPADYAEQLLGLARSVRSNRFSPALAMARSNTLEVRMKAIFDENRDHQPMDRRAGRILACAAVLLVVGLATAHPGVLADEPQAPKTDTKGTARITGRAVVAATGKPIAAEVVLLPPPPKGEDVYIGDLPLRGVKAGADGSFAFEGLAPGRYQVWANSGRLTSKKGHIRGDSVTIPESGETPKSVELKLVVGVEVTARLKAKETGKPIVGATVHLGWSDFREDAKTDAEGVATLQPLTKEKFLVEAWADGFVKSSQWLNLESGADATVDFTLAPGGDLTGMVRDPAGKPVEGVGLSASLDGSYTQVEYAKTGKDGRYRLAHMPVNTPLSLDVTKGDYLRRQVKAQVVGPTSKLDMTIEKRPHGGSITGVVLDAQGKPVAGAEIQNMGYSSSLVRETKTGPDGRFRLEDLYENHMGKEILVHAGGTIPKRLKVEPGPADKPTELRIDMETGHKIKGRVVDEKGKPLAKVWVFYADGNHGMSDGGRTETDKDGNFTFDTLPPDTPFTFQHPGYSQIEGRKLTLDGDEIVNVEMIPAAAIVGKVFDVKTGQPIRSFNVRVTFSPKKQPGEPNNGLLSSWVDPGLNYQSDKGEFRFTDLVDRMPLQVTVAAEGYEKHVAQRIVATRGDRAQTEEFAMEPIDPASLRAYRGRLVSTDGKPIVGVPLRLIASREPRGNDRRGYPYNWTMIHTGQIAQHAAVSRFLEGTTDKAGKFAFTGIPKDDEVELVWWGKGVAPGTSDHLELRDDKEREALEIVVPKPGKVTGAIDRKAFGPVAEVRLTSREVSDGIGLDLKPDQKEFEIDDLAPGVYQVYLYSPNERLPGVGNNGFTNRVVARGTVTVDAGGTSRIEFR